MGLRTSIAVQTLLLCLGMTVAANAQQTAPTAPPEQPPASGAADAAAAEDSTPAPPDGQQGGDAPEAPTGTDAAATTDTGARDEAGSATDTAAEAEPEPPAGPEPGTPGTAGTAGQPAVDAGGATPPPPPPPPPTAGASATSAASDDADGGAAQEPQKPEVPAPADPAPAFEPNWRGSGLAWSHSLAYGTFDRSLQPSYNPSYAWAFDAVLRWNFQPKLNARVIQSANVELTDSDSTTAGQQLLLSDTVLQADYRIGTLTLGEHQSLTLMARGAFVLPVSKASQAATLTAATTGRATLIWGVDEPLAGLSVIAAWNFRKNWNRDTTVVVDEPFPCVTAGSSVGSVDCRNGTLANVDWGTTALTVVNLQVTPAVSAALAYAHTWNRTYSLPAARVELLTGPETLAGTDRYRFRDVRVIDLTASYMPSPWWTLSLSITNQFAERGPDGKLRSPFDPQDMYLGASVFVTPPPPSTGQKQNLLNPINQ